MISGTDLSGRPEKISVNDSLVNRLGKKIGREGKGWPFVNKGQFSVPPGYGTSRYKGTAFKKYLDSPLPGQGRTLNKNPARDFRLKLIIIIRPPVILFSLFLFLLGFLFFFGGLGRFLFGFFLLSIDFDIGFLPLLGFAILFFELTYHNPDGRSIEEIKFRTDSDADERHKSPGNGR